MRSGKSQLIILISEDEVRTIMLSGHHEIVSFSEACRRCWGGKEPSCAVNIHDSRHRSEVDKLTEQLVKKHQEVQKEI